MTSELFDRINNSPMLKLMGQKLVSLDNGNATVECMPEAKYQNLMGRMHGGYVACLIDTVMGCAAHSKIPANINLGTVDLNVKFVRAIMADTGKLTATAEVQHAGRTMLTVNARVVDNAGKLYAHGSGTFLVYPKQ